MQPSLAAFLTEPSTLMGAFIGAFLGAVIVLLTERVRAHLRRRSWESYKQSRPDRGPREVGSGWGSPPGKPAPVPKPITDAAEQLRVVMTASFAARPLLNKSEARLFRELDAIVTVRNPGWTVMAQVSLGEILKSEDAEAYRCINSKRVDLLLVDADCNPRHAIEYQGKGHHQGSAAARDAVKKEALRRAGIGYHEVIAGQTTPSGLKHLVAGLVDLSKPEQSSPAGVPFRAFGTRPPSIRR